MGFSAILLVEASKDILCSVILPSIPPAGTVLEISMDAGKTVGYEVLLVVIPINPIFRHEVEGGLVSEDSQSLTGRIYVRKLTSD